MRSMAFLLFEVAADPVVAVGGEGDDAACLEDRDRAVHAVRLGVDRADRQDAGQHWAQPNPLV